MQCAAVGCSASGRRRCSPARCMHSHHVSTCSLVCRRRPCDFCAGPERRVLGGGGVVLLRRQHLPHPHRRQSDDQVRVRGRLAVSGHGSEFYHHSCGVLAGFLRVVCLPPLQHRGHFVHAHQAPGAAACGQRQQRPARGAAGRRWRLQAVMRWRLCQPLNICT